MDTWHDMGHMSNLSELEQKRGEMGMREKKAHFSCIVHERVREEKREKLQLISMIYKARLLGFYRAKNLSPSSR